MRHRANLHVTTVAHRFPLVEPVLGRNDRAQLRTHDLFGSILRQVDLVEARVRCWQPPIIVTEAAVKQWWSKYKTGGALLANAEELNDKYGDTVRRLVVEHNTAYKLTQALAKNAPQCRHTCR